MSKKQIDELKAELRKVRKELRDTHLQMLILYLMGAKATKIATDAGFDVSVNTDEMVDAIERFERGEIELGSIKEAAQ